MPGIEVEVGRLLTKRKKDFNAGVPFRDGCKLGLAVEGGGMRGVVSGAMLIALEDLGLKHLFDGYYGTSAGSINLAYFLAGWRWKALTMYYDHLSNNGFIDRWRPLRRRGPIVDMSLLFDDVMTNDLHLDYEAVLTASPKLHVGISALDDVEAMVVSEFSNTQELRAYLRAGAWLPILAGRPVLIGGKRFLDGGVFFASPIYVALQDGCTHIVSLGTRAQSVRKLHVEPWQYYLAQRLNLWQRGAGDLYLENLRIYFRHRELMSLGETRVGQARVYRVAVPASGHSVDRTTVDRSKLLDGARAGYVTVRRDLGGEDVTSAVFSVDV